MRPPGQLVALARLGADGQQAHRGLGDAVARSARKPPRAGRTGPASLAWGRRSRPRQPAGSGCGRVGSTTARAGRSSPGTDRSRSRAVATMPPVEPAETIAAAWPAPDQLAGHGHAGPGAAPAGQRALIHGDRVVGRDQPEQPGRALVLGQQRLQLGGPPGQDHRARCSAAAAAAAPATTSAGPLSPPIASTTMAAWSWAAPGASGIGSGEPGQPASGGLAQPAAAGRRAGRRACAWGQAAHRRRDRHAALSLSLRAVRARGRELRRQMPAGLAGAGAMLVKSPG